MKPFFLSLLFLSLQLMMINCSAAPTDPEEIVRGSWLHYKHAYIRDGRVIRPKNNNDTVSEGEAYAMLRAVLMDDRKTFDECLSWTQSSLSRKATHGDALLAWHYENGIVSDSTAATDADIDYAYALLLAFRTWQERRYVDLAREVLDSILKLETVERDGRLYLLPWPQIVTETEALLPQNPSYYAPSNFKLFYEVSGDKRWLKLADTGYDLLRSLQKSFNGEKGSGLVPDWCAVDMQGRIVPLSGRSSLYGWEATRTPLRIAADYHLYHDLRALGVLKRFSAFFDSEFSRNGRIFSEYACNGTTSNPYETPLFYSAAYAAAEAADSPTASPILERLRGFIKQEGEEFWYQDTEDYYVNSLSWLVEYYKTQKK
ncbi:MAG: endoglucanase [Chlorobiaceae bacterium]|jgi:endoglucanase|nr:endoglucanase [Chlorobiaceae bacterium]NTV16500.1 endoglucanase [Chlorobiaceae bacterium]